MSHTINDLIKQIEKLRVDLIKVKEGRAYTDPEVIAVSQALDEVLDEYQKLMLKNKTK
ncbi:aspartyl-phosphate phosphatase Spo0E family protein [Desulfosporosinus meridiei]|uniref:Spo0E like sporulation regulatory protein n=1 Tax=Desulfosporosinus meridiei (strain ATCC BAA-275 / DSM 13257 / KCTC 12902 / NCIMB 13706 / S10) TaxID=768704 RepID=J7IU97_DESMD|nr:aspartyl-phosphate phosphatase Spo0E family protein [Desulfosporosinus meridiei]AFQ43739.1 Spo0E like sporulation regulatory protein [Desulfosporosinus meridiei DSM 13257]